MRVVIDTNVVVSAALKDLDPEAVLVHVVERPEFEWMATQEIVDEYLEVLALPKLALSESVLGRWREVLARNVVLVDPAPPVRFARGRKDEKFLACALATAADYLITGDRDFGEASRLVATRIVSVSQFQWLFLPEPPASSWCRLTESNGRPTTYKAKRESPPRSLIHWRSAHRRCTILAPSAAPKR